MSHILTTKELVETLVYAWPKAEGHTTSYYSVKWNGVSEIFKPRFHKVHRRQVWFGGHKAGHVDTLVDGFGSIQQATTLHTADGERELFITWSKFVDMLNQFKRMGYSL